MYDTEKYEHLFILGKTGTGAGEFIKPIGIAIDDDGFIYVSDAGNHRIQKFTSTGNVIRSWGDKGKEKGQLDRPMHISFGPDNYLYVAEFLNDRVQVFDKNGVFIRFIGIKDDGSSYFNAPSGVVVDLQGNIYVTDFYHHQIKKFNSQGHFVASIGKPGRVWRGRFHYPTDAAIHFDYLYIADAYNHRIQKLSLQGAPIKIFGGLLGIGIPFSWYGFFNVATGIDVDAHGNIFVADFYNNRVQKLNPKGHILSVFGSKILRFPTDVALDKNRNVCVVDYGNNRLVQFRLKK